MRIALYALGILVGAVVIGALLIDEGEVVTLTTRGSGDDAYQTQLWVVELDDVLYLRAVSPHVRWLDRLRQLSEVELRRGEQALEFRAQPAGDPELRRSVNRAMAEKYGLSERMLGWLVDLDVSVPVRLEPAAGAETRAAPERGAASESPRAQP